VVPTGTVKRRQTELLSNEKRDRAGGGFCTGFSIGGKRFRGVVDTGSPFLLVSTCSEGAQKGSCNDYCGVWGCTTPTSGEPSGLEDTEEVYAAGATKVTWRRGAVDLQGSQVGKATYGAMLTVESYSGNGGGAFLGLIREKQERIRPTFLGQTDIRTVAVDLRTAGSERLELSPAALQPPPGADAIPLVDLRGEGAPVRYYAARVASLSFGGERVAWPGPIVAVLDTGTTGLGLPPGLFEKYDEVRRRLAYEIGLRAAQAPPSARRSSSSSSLLIW